MITGFFCLFAFWNTNKCCALMRAMLDHLHLTPSALRHLTQPAWPVLFLTQFGWIKRFFLHNLFSVSLIIQFLTCISAHHTFTNVTGTFVQDFQSSIGSLLRQCRSIQGFLGRSLFRYRRRICLHVAITTATRVVVIQNNHLHLTDTPQCPASSHLPKERVYYFLTAQWPHIRVFPNLSYLADLSDM